VAAHRNSVCFLLVQISVDPKSPFAPSLHRALLQLAELLPSCHSKTLFSVRITVQLSETLYSHLVEDSILLPEFASGVAECKRLLDNVSEIDLNTCVELLVVHVLLFLAV
jgi:hypothetical protein